MKSFGRQFSSIARLTMLEAMRQPISLLLLAACVLLIAALPFLITHTLGGAEKIVRDSAFAIHLVVGLLLGSYAACYTLVREIHRGTASTVLSKPVGRGTFMLAKYVGICAFMVLFSVAATMATLVSARVARVSDTLYLFDVWAALPLFSVPFLAFIFGAWVNYRRRSPFNSVAFMSLVGLVLAAGLGCAFVDHEGARAPFTATLPWAVVPASVLITMAILVITAIAVSLAPRLDLVPTIATCSIVLMVGLVSDYALGRVAADGRVWAKVLYTLVPNWQHFWVVDALHGGGRITADYVGKVAVYAACYSAGILAVGVLAFRRMELK
jgi:ABC-type transport system involved in multi-copper enzyme maturation permease subunit